MGLIRANGNLIFSHSITGDRLKYSAMFAGTKKEERFVDAPPCY